MCLDWWFGVWVKIKPPGYGPQVETSMFPFTRVPFWGSPILDPPVWFEGSCGGWMDSGAVCGSSGASPGGEREGKPEHRRDSPCGPMGRSNNLQSAFWVCRFLRIPFFGGMFQGEKWKTKAIVGSKTTNKRHPLAKKRRTL